MEIANDEERTIAERVRGRHGAAHTAIEPLGTFHLAEDYHQKYWLRSDSKLLALFGPDARELVDSPLAAKLNGIVGGREMRREELESLLARLAVPGPVADHLRALVRP